MALKDWLPYFPELEDQSKQNKKNIKVHCPFHEDSTPSFSIDVERNLANCFGCNWGGNFEDFERDIKVFNLGNLIEERKSTRDQKKKKGEQISPFLLIADSNQFVQNLLASKRHLELLHEKRLLNDSTIEKYQLGLENDRIIVPIRDSENRIINFRKYSFTLKPKCISVIDHGKTAIFPIENLQNDEIIFCAGEMDTLLANQFGYNAVTLTTGENASLPEKYLPSLRGKTIMICYDLDKAGEDGAKKLKNSLLLFAKEVRIITLPKELGDGGDFTDFFLQEHLKEELDALLCEQIEEVTLEDLSLSKHWNRRVQVTAKISGKNVVPFLVPKKIKLKCNRTQGNLCGSCALASGELELEFFPSNPIYLELIENPKEKIERILRNQINIPKKCKVKIEKLEFENVEALRLLPAELFSTSREYITRQVYYVGAGIKSNIVCKLQGIVIPEPKLQFATFLIDKAEQKTGILDLFHRSHNLDIFRSDDVQGKLIEIYRDFEANVTFIFGRSEILTVLDLVYFSPITFRFAGKYVSKGWAEALIIGDSRQGKSDSVKAIIQHYGLGVLCGAESASVAGLKGGVAQVGRQWQLQWGLIPLNHRSIVAIDDFQKTDPDVISSLSRIRSEGIAEIQKIEAQQVRAQTRLVWISNPVKDRTLSTYACGIEAVADLIEQPSDIARFDLVVCIQEGEVDMTQIPLYLQEKREHVYTSKLCKELLLWNWSRKPEQIVFSEDTEKKIFQVSNEILDKYRSPIPIVKSGEEHIVIAKLAVATAGRLFSTDETEEKIVVHPRHVQFVKQFLFDIWDSNSCLYNEFAFQKKQEGQIEDEEEVREAIGDSRRSKKLIVDLLRNQQLILSDFEDLLSTDRSATKLFVSILRRNRALIRKRSYYEKTPAFIRLLRQMQDPIGDDPPF